MTVTPTAPRTAALNTLLARPVEANDTVSYRSAGRLLIVGRAAAVSGVLASVAGSLETSVLITDACPPALARRLRQASVPYRAACGGVAIDGYLGAFDVRLQGAAIKQDEAPPFDCHGPFDLILDLETPPLHRPSLAPVGYFAPAGDPARLARTLEQLPEMVGEFDKPKFFQFKPALCAHSASGLTGCRQCLDACATGAIGSQAGNLAVNPYLCQGCGDCAAVCPSGAMNYAFPDRNEQLGRIRTMLKAYFQAGGTAPVLLLHDSEAGREWIEAQPLPEVMLPFEVEAPGAAGMDIWLAALAYGAAAVVVLEYTGITPETRRTLATQTGFAGELLAGLGLPAAIVVATPEQLSRGCTPWETMPLLPPAAFAPDPDKRTVIRLALEHLRENLPAAPHAVPLSSGAPFGAIGVDTGRCTLCMACVSICPASALADGGDFPRLKFIEANCVQCGLCRNGCPEQAIRLIPRYRYDSSRARRAQVLHEEEAFHCIQCGNPFAARSMIQTLQQKLQGHPMFQGDNRRRLLMCDTCRVKSMFGGESERMP